ncbi:hypothetical protein FK521_29930, partial [Klebsiella pneumoniae]|nr:hypothetical protein [Klebsiella pneumoniae]
NRDWEDGYRQRWQHDKIVRSTHGVNCTGSCSWKIYVKNAYGLCGLCRGDRPLRQLESRVTQTLDDLQNAQNDLATYNSQLVSLQTQPERVQNA